MTTWKCERCGKAENKVEKFQWLPTNDIEEDEDDDILVCRDCLIKATIHASDWLGVTARLPPVDNAGCSDTVLVVTELSDGTRIVVWGRYFKSISNLSRGYGFWMPSTPITHWMPIPELPTKGD